MHISLNWINEFTSLPALSPKEISEKFTLTTAEVEGVKILGSSLEKVIVVEIVSIRKHPEAEKLNLVTITWDHQALKEVVCGASNVKVGLIVPYAPVGTTLPNGMTLEPKKIRGILSDGMLCSSQELGLGEGAGGLLELPRETKIGQSLKDYLKQDSDVILEVDNKSLTHRPDLWGHFGIAREFATAFKTELKNTFNDSWKKDIEQKIPNLKGKISFKVDPESSCWAYLGINISSVQLKATPKWMTSRLTAVGLRSINPMVDISNYVMLELGIPNHIFDADKIKGNLSIKKLKSSLEFITLDDIKRQLVEGDTVICDEEGPLVLAGIMGGARCAVDEQTKNVFIEVANWDPVATRKTSVRLGLRTDSSQRYEKTLDSNLCHRTLLRLVDLITKEDPKAQVTSSVDQYINEKTLSKELKLSISHHQIISTLGKEIETKDILLIFSKLGFVAELKDQIYHLVIPTWRTTKDISCAADLIEEIGRVIGYDHILPSSPLLSVTPVRLTTKKELHRHLQNFYLYEAKSLEIMTYPMIGENLLKQSLWPELNLHLKMVNALSEDQDRMRPSMIPSVIQAMGENQKYFNKFSFFELGRSYLDYTDERSQIMHAVFDRDQSAFITLLNHVEKLLSSLGIPFEFVPKNEKFSNSVINQNWSGLHPHEFVQVKVMGKNIGSVFTVHPQMMKRFKAKGHFSIFVFELNDLEKRKPKERFRFLPIARFPSTTFDCSVQLEIDRPASDPLMALNKLKIKEIKSKAIADVFILNDSFKSVTLRVVFENPDETLTPDFIKKSEQEVVSCLAQNGFSLRT